ncbi:co-chaperone YbbN [Campylobacter sp. 19-13652]|uniref:thioredoxin family protein n=1 Tax=Campylobacter sp. 19-13652 TaxID=2840180 RepID=UPI001C74ED95|nr:thioredoxin family protein [Campylobacter sp. 19-13652]BCX78601.1 thiol reductase thioredoxin [Campylobacter sp. 19-13652]
MKEIDFEQFEQEFKSGVKVFYFGAPWCRDCKFAKPILEELAGKFADRASFFAIDVDKEEGVRDAMGIRHIPTILFVRDGAEQGQRLVEPKSREAIEARLAELLK